MSGMQKDLPADQNAERNAGASGCQKEAGEGFVREDVASRAQLRSPLGAAALVYLLEQLGELAHALPPRDSLSQLRRWLDVG